MSSLLFFLPEGTILLIANILLILGLIGIFISFVLQRTPLITAIPYSLIISVLSTTLLVAGVYVRGFYSASEDMNNRIKEMENKVEKAVLESKIATGRVEYVYLDRIKEVKDTQIVIQEKIRDISLTIDKECKVVPEVIEILNNSARNKK